MGRKCMATALTRAWRVCHGNVGSIEILWWIRVLPTIALARVSFFTAGVDGKLLQLLLNRPTTDSLLPLLKPLYVALLYVALVHAALLHVAFNGTENLSEAGESHSVTVLTSVPCNRQSLLCCSWDSRGHRCSQSWGRSPRCCRRSCI